tara:strand:- start:200 stop:625 length:426 start_codon:yes stop_codon:yes gene_type:complete
MSSSNQAGLLPALHQLQERYGFIPNHAIDELARAHNIAQAEVVGVIGFYHDFRQQPRGHLHLQICRAESCQAMGGEALAMYAEKSLGIKFGSTSDGGEATLEAVYCLGNCACSPAIMLDGELYGRVSTELLDTLIAEGKGE